MTRLLLSLLVLLSCNVTSKVPLSHDQGYRERSNFWKSKAEFETKRKAHSLASIYYENASKESWALAKIRLEELRLLKQEERERLEKAERILDALIARTNGVDTLK